ncbi:MAG TPA: DNA mismatch repair endonuclease MutL [bacterium]|nr:DNA mismatch repair endonuclease MutL [bacterium]
MGRIKALDELTISKIAAGEVVERPVAVVKELVENALDAGATEIVVDIEDGGRKLIRVSDNGTGMSREDAEICLKSHSTSKLGSIDDLERVHTLGFRGEALHSIGSVSTLTVTTSDNENGEGWRVRMEGGAEKPLEAAARPRGTTIEVENLFYNVPARRKFIKSARSEIQAVNSMMSKMIVAYPGVAFTQTHNGSPVFKAAGAADMKERIRYIFGKDIADKVERSDGEMAGMRIEAWFTMPDLAFPNRRYQMFVVNGRVVNDKHLAAAVQVACRGLVPSGRHCMAILFLDAPASDIDPNVHPTKSEVRFLSPHDVHSLVYRTIRGRFTEPGIIEPKEILNPIKERNEPAAAGRTSSQHELNIQVPEKPERSAATESSEVHAHPFDEEAAPRPHTQSVPENRSSIRKTTAENEYREPSRIAGHDFKVLGQFFKTYILIDLDGYPMFIDQHVASERIIYNELRRKTKNSAEQLQLISEPVETPRDVYEILSRNLERAREAGLTIEPFGERAFIIRAVAHSAGPFDPVELLAAIADEIRSAPDKAPENLLTGRLLTVAACRMAVKAGQTLTHAEMDALVERYLKEEFNRTCPHGRPITHKLTREALDVWFKR